MNRYMSLIRLNAVVTRIAHTTQDNSRSSTLMAKRLPGVKQPDRSQVLCSTRPAIPGVVVTFNQGGRG